MRRLVAVLGCLTLGAAIVAPAQASAAVGSLTPSGDAKFPNRSFVLTLPAGTAPTPGDVSVLEDGQPVVGLHVVPADSRFAVLLVIDASPSMRGAPIEGAMAAARAFAAQRPPAQALGVLTFNDTAHVLLKPTTDGAAIRQALRGTPPIEPRTHIYDAVSTALGQLQGSRFDAGAVVVLSDGHDFGSSTPPAEVARQARRVHGHLFSVGLRSAAFDPSTLEDIARTGGGDYLGAASASALAGVYQRLGGQLGSAYTIRYRSLAPAGSKVAVTAGTGDQLARRVYSAPALSVPGATTGAAPKDDTSFLGSTTGAIVVAIAVMLLVLLSLLIVLGSRQRRVQLRQRVNEYAVTGAPGTGYSDYDAAGRRRDTSRIRARLDDIARALDIAGVEITATRLVWYVIGATLAGSILLVALTGSLLFVPLVLIAGPFGTRAYVHREMRKRRDAFADQLADTVQGVASSMRTGNSFAGAVAQIAQSSPEPMATELRRVVADERLGVPLEDAFEVAIARMDNRDLRQVALVSVLQRETGGNGAEALDRVVENIHGRDDVRRLVRTLTAQGRFAQRVLTALPIVTLILLTATSYDTMEPLYTTTAGHIALALAASLVAIGGVWIRKLVDIKV